MNINNLDINQQAQTQAQTKTGATQNKLSDSQRLNLQMQQVKASYSFSASITEGDNYYNLLFQATYESISSSLQLDTSTTAVQPPTTPDDSQIDVSPEATAKRILDMSTGFLELFKKQHPGEDEATVLKNFMDTIGSGIEQGFKEARGILDGLGVLKGDIAGNIDKTWDLVQSGLKDFADKAGKPAEPTLSK
ncbi:DUF5610 domain-containing protein [Chitinimonas naiadis]